MIKRFGKWFRFILSAMCIAAFVNSTSAQEIQTIPGISQSLQPQPEKIEPSPIERYVRGQMTTDVSLNISQFGYELFSQPPTTFAPVDAASVGPDYVIGPGDEIKITLWGKIEGNYHIVVDRDGNITIPKVGVLTVVGMNFEQLKSFIQKEISKYYKNFNINITLGSLRGIRVFVVGNAMRPGSYVVSNLSTLINALFASGGPSKTGSMRNIELKREGRTVVTFDMYDFIIRGDKTRDIRLLPGDVIFIPPIGQVAAIAGSVKVPAIYELKGETRVSELIGMAGGLLPIAFSGRVQVERIEGHERHTVFEDDLSKALKEPLRDFVLKDGDIVKVYPVGDIKLKEYKFVSVNGAVIKPGDYGLTEGMTIKDIISLAGGLEPYADIENAELTRISITQAGPKTERININLKKAIEGDPHENLLLKPMDFLLVKNIPEWELPKRVLIKGEVRFPGTYVIKKGERLSDLIERAGGYTEKAYLRGAVFTKERVRELQQRQIDEMVDRLERELLSVGTAEIATALSPEEAKIKEFEIRQKGELVAKLRAAKAKGRMAIRLEQPELLRKTPYDIELEEGDSLYIPSNPQTVQVAGAVYNQTAFVYDKDRDISSYIDLAGGYTENADKKRVYILKVDGTAARAGGGFLVITWDKDSNRWEFGGQKLEPGDTIVVPEKLERIVWMREIKDITQILYQIAVTTGVLIAAF